MKLFVFILSAFIIGCGQTDKPKTTDNSSYEILNNRSKGFSTELDVYIKQSEDQDIIKINDELLKEYEGKAMGLLINYFNDKKTAQEYFTKVDDQQISYKDKWDLKTHYVAAMKMTSDGKKVLYKNIDNKDWKEIKSY